MVWAKAGPFANLGTADRRAFALAHCIHYISERLYCQYKRSLILDFTAFIRGNATRYFAFRLAMTNAWPNSWPPPSSSP